MRAKPAPEGRIVPLRRIESPGFAQARSGAERRGGVIESPGFAGARSGAERRGGVIERRAAVSEISDEALLAACGVGDTSALGALFDRHHEAIYRLVSRLLVSEFAEIDDIVQTTFLEVWRSAKRYGGRGSVRSFLFGIAANTVRHHVRSVARRRRAFAAWPEPFTTGAPDIAAMRSQQVHRLAAALDELPHDLRVAYVLCDLEDLAGVEAARILGIRAGTLWRRLHDARRLLREAIDEEGTR